MKTPRFYNDQALTAESRNALSEHVSHHALRVLRLKVGAKIRVFDGNHQYLTEIAAIENRRAVVEILEILPSVKPSPLSIHLGQGLSKGDRMDVSIQKAVELGVTAISPILTERCEVRLDERRLQKKMQHWQGIIISACEQCERDDLVQLHPPIKLANWLEQDKVNGFVCDPLSKTCLTDYSETIAQCRLLIGPEGGLTEKEIELAKQAGLNSLSLGPRVLRTETATITALSLLQARWGDLN